MDESLVPTDLLPRLKCSLCSAYLSVFPILISVNDEGPVCGRCHLSVDNQNYLRDKAYEEMAEYLHFPCSNQFNGCLIYFLPEKIKLHEPRCTFRTVHCPAQRVKHNDDCTWEGRGVTLKKHFETTHYNLILKGNKYFLNFGKNSNKTFLLELEDELFIVRININSSTGIFSCSVEQVAQKADSYFFNYYISVQSDTATESYHYPQRSCFSLTPEVTTFTHADVKEKLNDAKSITAVIAVVKTNLDSTRQFQRDVAKGTVDHEIDWESLEVLKCSICFEYMVSPIIQCISGHSMCFTCGSILKCPLCDSLVNPNENSALEGVIASLRYPCKYRKEGCMASAMSTLIRSHEYSCEYRTYDCPLFDLIKCLKRCTKTEATSHVEANHNNYIIGSERIEITIADPTCTFEHCFLITHASRVFNILFIYGMDSVRWSAIFVGPAEECKNFKFQIDLIDSSGKNLWMSAQALCTPTKERKISCSIRERHVQYLCENINKLFVVENKLSFRARIHSD